MILVQFIFQVKLLFYRKKNIYFQITSLDKLPGLDESVAAGKDRADEEARKEAAVCA